MAEKKNNAPSKPIVSRVPLPVSDSALVIDLPDGQKLVIGKMSQGSVIEVATWRGVGRPDSRTSRMMFGMSSAEIDVESPTQESGSTAEIAGSFVSQILNYPMALIRWLFNIQHTPKPKKNKDGSKKLIIQANESQPNSDGVVTKKSIGAIAKAISVKFLAIISNGFSISSGKIFKLLKRETSAKVSTIKATSTDIDVEKWLDSLTSATKKTEIKTPIDAPMKRKSKK